MSETFMYCLAGGAVATCLALYGLSAALWGLLTLCERVERHHHE